MLSLELQKEQEIKNMVSILEQIDLSDIILLTRDANTLLMRQREAESRKEAGQGGERNAVGRCSYIYVAFHIRYKRNRVAHMLYHFKSNDVLYERKAL